MILQLYFLLVIISFIFIILGYYLKQNAHIFKLAGFTIFFMLSVMIIPNTTGGIQYQTGYNEYYVYGNNFTDYHWDYEYSLMPNDVDTPFLFHTTHEYVYTSYENFIIGFSLALCSFFGFVNVFFQMKREDD